MVAKALRRSASNGIVAQKAEPATRFYRNLPMSQMWPKGSMTAPCNVRRELRRPSVAWVYFLNGAVKRGAGGDGSLERANANENGHRQEQSRTTTRVQPGATTR